MAVQQPVRRRSQSSLRGRGASTRSLRLAAVHAVECRRSGRWLHGRLRCPVRGYPGIQAARRASQILRSATCEAEGVSAQQAVSHAGERRLDERLGGRVGRCRHGVKGFGAETWTMRDGKIAIWEAAFNAAPADQDVDISQALRRRLNIRAHLARRRAVADEAREGWPLRSTQSAIGWTAFQSPSSDRAHPATRVWLNRGAASFQTEYEGSIPFTRSNKIKLFRHPHDSIRTRALLRIRTNVRLLFATRGAS
jgi:hypothetical protein